MEADAFHFFRNIMEILRAVDVAEDTVPDAVFFHERENAQGAPLLIIRRIMEHADDAAGALLFRQLDAPQEAAFLAAQDRLVVFREIAGRFRDPAPRAGQSDRADHDDIVVKKFKSAAGGFRHLCHRIPPVIVIAPDDDLSAGERGDPHQVGQRFGEAPAPGQVARENDCIFRADRGEPRGADLFPMAFPVAAENIHGFGRRIAGEVKITECVKFHGNILIPRSTGKNEAYRGCIFCCRCPRPA